MNAMMESIKILKQGIKYWRYWFYNSKHVEARGFSVVRDFCGHGLGRNFHELPNILHYGEQGTGDKLKTGMIFTIEPMINEGNMKLMY